MSRCGWRLSCGRRDSGLLFCVFGCYGQTATSVRASLKAGVEVCPCHPKLVETGLDCLPFRRCISRDRYSRILRQASRRSWRIGQRHDVRVKFVTYPGTMQENCLRSDGKKMLEEGLRTAMLVCGHSRKPMGFSKSHNHHASDNASRKIEGN